MDGSDEEGLEIRLLRFALLASSKLKLELSNYDGSLSTEVLLDWISHQIEGTCSTVVTQYAGRKKKVK